MIYAESYISWKNAKTVWLRTLQTVPKFREGIKRHLYSRNFAKLEITKSTDASFSRIISTDSPVDSSALPCHLFRQDASALPHTSFSGCFI